MLETAYAVSADGAHLAYNVTGNGPALMLLHGFSGDRKMTWHAHGIVDRLADHFRVITMDLRGCGESDGFDDPARYTAQRHIDDVHAVADACHFDSFRVWGWSFGATIGLHLAALSNRIERAVIAGTYFGRIFTPEYVQKTVTRVEALAQTPVDELAADDRDFVQRTNIPVYLARCRALESWAGIEPDELRCSTLVLTGTEDGNVIVRLREQRAAIERASLQLHIFDQVNHVGLISQSDLVVPVAEEFLKRG
ncbi:MAG TPA: alpha/beta hydrolase [Aggregatilineaceae bacterium]|nr:alpha/beta hydrolase [Aggregatilineaceae bacterium]